MAKKEYRKVTERGFGDLVHEMLVIYGADKRVVFRDGEGGSDAFLKKYQEVRAELNRRGEDIREYLAKFEDMLGNLGDITGGLERYDG